MTLIKNTIKILNGGQKKQTEITTNTKDIGTSQPTKKKEKDLCFILMGQLTKANGKMTKEMVKAK
jgi:hypothetical protein